MAQGIRRPLAAAMLGAGVLAGGLLAAAPARAFDGWHLVQATTIPGKGSAWDYVALDAPRGHLFIGHRKEGLQVFDIATGKVVKVIDKTQAASSNGATLMPEFDLGISNNEDGTIIPFSLSTLEARAPVKLGEELDTSHYDAGNKRVVVNMAAGKDGTDAVVLEAPSLQVLGTIKLPSRKIEGADSDGKGAFFIASRDMDKVFRVDTRTMQVTADWPTPGCAQTNSLTVDAAHDRILLGCRGSDTVKPSFAVMDARTGKVIYTGEIGGGNDSIVYDPELRRIFLANGVGAVLNVFEQVDADTYKPVETLGTRAGMRTMQIDPKTKRLYSVVAEGAADAGKKILTSVSPFYANTFYPDTFTVLTFAKD
ncbi:YncE family protein [Limobrevibacterium gyesilva]|uniref:YncE family protein n=1 Tax=Limobrevibacterium gyesilva TaxID=2991712 RepID=A0AA41YN36_9PROT|nr:hypothetical protein [Limobrevibacterium gyesilva]MCW3476544.1 hypothetical protein [Limobrevibacterium gyesilva]